MLKLSEFVKKARFERNLTQIDLAEECGLSHLTIIKIERGEKVGSNSLAKLSKGLKRSLKSVIKMMEEENENN